MNLYVYLLFYKHSAQLKLARKYMQVVDTEALDWAFQIVSLHKL